MKFAPLLTVLLVSSMTSPGHGWGHVFSQFTPRILDSLGYGYSARSVGGYQEAPLPADEEESEETKAACRGKPCLSNEQCCEKYLCIESTLSPASSVYGMCMPHYHREGHRCHSHSDCGASLVCNTDPVHMSTCRRPNIRNHAYYESCGTSTDCNVSRGLCCQLLRQHRQTPRKACLYYNDPLMCIGYVPVEQVNKPVEHMASEKRYTERRSIEAN